MLPSFAEKSEGSFYRGYQLSTYQHKMLLHLLREEDPEYTVIPDWQNLFIVTLLYAQMLTAKYKTVVVYSKWSIADVMNVLQDVPDFYELYTEVIQQSVQLVRAEYGSELKGRIETEYAVGMGTDSVLTVNYSRENTIQPQLTLTLKVAFTDFTKIHPSYVEEQIHSVWAIDQSPGYKMTDEAFYVDRPVGKKTLLKHKYFAIDAAFENTYALYALLARSGDGEKMFRNYFTYPTDYGPGGYSEGMYLWPLKFYLELPTWLSLRSGRSERITEGLSYLEAVLLTHEIRLPKSDDERVRRYAKAACDKFALEVVSYHDYLTYRLPGNQNKRYWALIDPSKELCDTLVLSDNLGRISAKEEERLKLLERIREGEERLREMKWKLERAVREPRSRETYTVAELKSIAKDGGVNIKGLKTKADIAKEILKNSNFP